MKLKAIVDQLQQEASALQGETAKDKQYASQATFADEQAAGAAFARSVTKLLTVNGWSNLSSLSADFALYDPVGRAKPDGPVEVNDYIQIKLPGPTPANWVRVVQLSLNTKRAEFTVQPSPDPVAGKPDQIEHFFTDQARSTFRVEWSGSTLSAFEIGRQETINNQQPQAGERALVNTVIAETGWLFYQKIQWQLLTDYLVEV